MRPCTNHVVVNRVYQALRLEFAHLSIAGFDDILAIPDESTGGEVG